MSDLTFSNLQEVEPLWRSLDVACDNLFSTWEWADAWWRHFGAGNTLEVRCVHDEAGRAVAILPLYSQRRAGLRVERMIGNGVGDQLGPVCGPSGLGAARDAMQRSGGDLFLAERLPAEVDWRPLGGRVLKTEASPAISIPSGSDWDDYLRARSANFRQQVRRRGRKLAGTLGVSFRLADDPERLGSDMQTLMELHRARWGHESRAFGPERVAFHRDFAAVAQERGWLRLWLAEAEGRPVAAWYGFRFADVEYFYQSGRDPEWDSTGIGAGLLEHSIREAFADGMREYRLLRGDESYKQRYATEARAVVTVGVPRSAGGRAAVTGAARMSRLPRARKVLRRAAG